MLPEQAKFLLFKAAAGYPNQIELEEETVALWVERLEPVAFKWALDNLNYHLDSNRYFPVLADVIRPDLVPAQNQDVLRLEASNHMNDMERWASADEPPPVGYWDDIKAKARGVTRE